MIVRELEIDTEMIKVHMEVIEVIGICAIWKVIGQGPEVR